MMYRKFKSIIIHIMIPIFIRLHFVIIIIVIIIFIIIMKSEGLGVVPFP